MVVSLLIFWTWEKIALHLLFNLWITYVLFSPAKQTFKYAIFIIQFMLRWVGLNWIWKGYCINIRANPQVPISTLWRCHEKWKIRWSMIRSQSLNASDPFFLFLSSGLLKWVFHMKPSLYSLKDSISCWTHAAAMLTHACKKEHESCKCAPDSKLHLTLVSFSCSGCKALISRTRSAGRLLLLILAANDAGCLALWAQSSRIFGALVLGWKIRKAL